MIAQQGPGTGIIVLYLKHSSLLKSFYPQGAFRTCFYGNSSRTAKKNPYIFTQTDIKLHLHLTHLIRPIMLALGVGEDGNSVESLMVSHSHFLGGHGAGSHYACLVLASQHSGNTALPKV